jgi:hypothetical protein
MALLLRHHCEVICPPDGQITSIFDRRRARKSLSAHQNRMRGKTNFGGPFKPFPRSSPAAENISISFFPKLMFPVDVPCSSRGALRGRHERWARDAVDVSELQRAIRAPANNSDADGQAAWSWHPDADAKLVTTLSRRAGDGGQKARRTGESAE